MDASSRLRRRLRMLKSSTCLQALAAASAVPGLFPEVLQLLTLGITCRKSGAEICLAALESAMQRLPSPPLESSRTSTAMAVAVHQATEAVLKLPGSWQNPAVLKALFALWTRGLAAGPGGCFAG
ncbi:unnamed protein product [Symbiodinium pilosum]|uniref:Uncharacterized protein n=1 Tax=Symbiodinium pilosum TaxID=2952 RepID=A0A812YEV0_SYMPI|nr:unnamed protein product [Symbiodinium pilosum]